MLRISDKQLAPFKEQEVQRFIDEMLEHINTFFPNHVKMLGEPGIISMIRHGIRRAGKYGLSTKRAVCSYLNLMIVWGSHFDTDPQYSWAASILNGDDLPEEKARKLGDRAVRLFILITGRKQVFVRRLLLKFSAKREQVFDTITGCTYADATEILSGIYPQKFAAHTQDEIAALLNYSKWKGRNYRIAGEGNMLLMAVFMFLLGADFDIDPKYAANSEILTNMNVDEVTRIRLMYETALKYLDLFIVAE